MSLISTILVKLCNSAKKNYASKYRASEAQNYQQFIILNSVQKTVWGRGKLNEEGGRGAAVNKARARAILEEAEPEGKLLFGRMWEDRG